MKKEAKIKIKASIILEDLKEFLVELKNTYRSVNDIEIADKVEFYIECLDQIIAYFKKIEKGRKNKQFKNHEKI